MFTLSCLVDNNTLDKARFQAEHGVAFSIQNPSGHILFDTGQSGDVLVHNAAQLGIDLGQVEALALSHAHYDHCGGLEAFLQRAQPGISFYAHSDLFRPRYSFKNGEKRSIGMRMTKSELAQRTSLHLSTEPVEILPGLWTTGEITGRTEFEGRSSYHYIQSGKDWLPDPYRDDMALVAEVQGGLVVICGCCHAGLLNTLAHVRRIFNKKITAIIGGAHLASVSEENLEHAISILRLTSAGDVPYLYLNHCTGERALAALAKAFPGRVNPYPAGAVLRFA